MAYLRMKCYSLNCYKNSMLIVIFKLELRLNNTYLVSAPDVLIWDKTGERRTRLCALCIVRDVFGAYVVKRKV